MEMGDCETRVDCPLSIRQTRTAHLPFFGARARCRAVAYDYVTVSVGIRNRTNRRRPERTTLCAKDPFSSRYTHSFDVVSIAIIIIILHHYQSKEGISFHFTVINVSKVVKVIPGGALCCKNFLSAMLVFPVIFFYKMKLYYPSLTGTCN